MPVSTSAAGLQLPRETVTKLRSTLSHPSEFWVTSVENYEANGVLFKGNLRAKDVQKAYASTASRLKVCLLEGCVTASLIREAISFVPAGWIHCLGKAMAPSRCPVCRRWQLHSMQFYYEATNDQK